MTESAKLGRVNSWRQWVEPWYLVYAVQGMIVAGLLPILLPLAASHASSAANIGLMMAAFSLGGLTAPAWGGLADHFRMHRWLLVGGLLVMSAGLLVFSITMQPGLWIGLALLVGLGAAGSATVANLFVVEAHPKVEWDERIGWLQTFYGIGQVCGLLLAGVLGQVDLRVGLMTGAGLCGLGAILGWLTTKTPSGPVESKPVLAHPARHGEWVNISPQQMFHRLDLAAIRRLGPSLRSPFGIFLGVWILAIGGSAAFFSQYPILMEKVYGIAPGISSGAFAVVAGLGLILYSPAGNWSERFGAVGVMRAALGIRWIAYIGLLLLAFIHVGFQTGVAILGFGLVVCAWSIISVSGTTLAAQLSPFGEGEGLGVFNAANALAGVVGAALGGWVAGLWGYNFIAVLAVVGMALSLGLSILLPAVSAKAGN